MYNDGNYGILFIIILEKDCCVVYVTLVYLLRCRYRRNELENSGFEQKNDRKMKKKKGYGLFGTNKRKPVKKADKYTEEYYEEYDEEEYDSEYYSEDEDGAYYEDGNYAVDEYAESEEYYEDEYYESEGYDESYADEAYEEQQDYAEDESYYADDYNEADEYYGEEMHNEADEYYEEEEYNEADEYYEEEAYYESDEYYESEEYDDSEEYYEGDYADSEEEYLYAEYDNEEGFDTGYEGYQTQAYEYDEEEYYEDEYVPLTFWERVKEFVSNLTAFDAIVALTGVGVLVAAVITFGMISASNKIEEQIQAIVPVGTELSSVGIVGESGLLAMADAGIVAQQDTEIEAEEVIQSVEEEPDSQQQEVRVSVSFTSVERDLKIRFTDSTTGALITGTAFEVTLTNKSSGNKLVVTDDDKDGIIYATSIKAGKFDAVITSTDKYKFPTTAQQVTVKDKVEYVVINVQDEVKTESQVNVAVEDTEVKADAVTEEVKLTDTVQWVESSKQVASGTEGYTKIDKNTIPDPSQLSLAHSRMAFDTLNVSLNKNTMKLYAGSSETLQGTTYSDYTEGQNEYQFTTEWKSSNENVATVSNGTVTAKGAGTATITYTVIRKTITTKIVEEIPQEPESSVPDASTPEESTPEKPSSEETKSEEGTTEETSSSEAGSDNTGDASGETAVMSARAKTEVSEKTDYFSAECVVTVENISITAGQLEITKSADACSVKRTLTVSPTKLTYTKNDGSKETITQNFPAVTWSSSDTSIATVDDKGVVTGVKKGTATITGQIKGIKDASGKELDIKATTSVTINAADALSLKLDREQVWLAVGGNTTLVPTVTNYLSDQGVTWASADEKIAKVDEKGKVTGVGAGTVKITATTKEKDISSGKQITAICVVTINSDATADTSTRLKDKDGRQVYIKNSEGKYVEAVYADYFKASEFFIMNEVKYVYTGWQTINGKTYYYDKNGNAVTGTQIIQGVTYNFGSDGSIQTNVNGSTFGIDVSKHNGKIDWNAVKSSGVDYVIIRCAYRGSSTGALITDPNFHTNIKGATAAGLKVGIYVFSQAINEVEAVKEASLAVSLAQGYNLAYPIFIDTEASGGRADKIDKATRTAVVNAFCQTVQNAGYKPGIYASKTWYEDKLNMGTLGGYKIWLAQYSAAPTYAGRYDMWQYSCKGKISGISGNVDLNLSYLGY